MNDTIAYKNINEGAAGFTAHYLGRRDTRREQIQTNPPLTQSKRN
jgi:hypothetical protein